MTSLAPVPATLPVWDTFTYEARRVISAPVSVIDRWRIKPYLIAFPDPLAEQSVGAYPLEWLLLGALGPKPDGGFHGPGFAVLHEGRDGAYLLVARWYAGHNLASDTYRVVRSGEGFALERMSLFACIWEMSVYAFERDAWVRTVMSGRGLDGVGDYLACRLEGYL